MKRQLVITALALLCAAPASAEFAPIEMSIPFADNGGIRDWQAIDNDSLYVQDRQGNWYIADLFGSATDLPYANAIGFDAGPTGKFDRFSAVIVGDQRISVKRLVASGPPLPKDLRRKFLQKGN